MSDTMIAIGGCHIAGYKVGEENSFINVMADTAGFDIIHKAANFEIKRNIEIREKINKHQPDTVLLQLGNYEFHASLKELFREKKNYTGSRVSGGSGQLSELTNEADDRLMLPMVKEKKAGFVIQNLVTPFIWKYLNWKNKAHFSNIKSIIRENPGINFIILSPIPCYKISDNLIRNKAGKWYRKLFAAMPNVTYIDLFRYIAADKRYFEDPAHLNITGHRILGKIVGHYLKPFRKERAAQLAAAV
ncbi:MAG TPA: hypothetical protein VFV31_14590 [Chitinophagaceae bacterium]|nr:hypothetical protein [Chitinophagaceae bacterium]